MFVILKTSLNKIYKPKDVSKVPPMINILTKVLNQSPKLHKLIKYSKDHSKSPIDALALRSQKLQARNTTTHKEKATFK